MKWYQIGRVDHKIKLRPRKRASGDSNPFERNGLRISHELKLKPMKIMKRLLRFWF